MVGVVLGNAVPRPGVSVASRFHQRVEGLAGQRLSLAWAELFSALQARQLDLATAKHTRPGAPPALFRVNLSRAAFGTLNLVLIPIVTFHVLLSFYSEHTWPRKLRSRHEISVSSLTLLQAWNL